MSMFVSQIFPDEAVTVKPYALFDGRKTQFSNSLSNLDRRKDLEGRHLTLCAVPYPPTMSDDGGKTFYGPTVEIIDQGGNSIDFKTSRKSSRKSNLIRRYALTTYFFMFLDFFIVTF